MAIEPANRAELLGRLSPEWPHDLLPEIQALVRASRCKIVVLDDDPTGTQTVYDIPVLIGWSVEALSAELASELPAFYILTNSRSLSLSEAKKLNTEIGRNLIAAVRQTDRPIAVVSRSDSTLRGHYPGEVDALAEVLGVRVDATLLIPFFLEGGRYTIDDIHYVAEGNQLIPAAQTPFANDAVFGYRVSNLKGWVQEKTAGRVQTADVAAVSIEDIRVGGPDRVAEKLLGLTGGRTCVVNAASYRDVEVFVVGLLRAEARGRVFVYRTAASFVRVRAGIGPRDLLTRDEISSDGTGRGLFIVGSYVPRSTSQLNELLRAPGIVSLEVDVHKVLGDADQAAELSRITKAANDALSHGQDVVIHTSREYALGSSAEQNLAIGRRVSGGLITIVQGIDVRPRYVVAKGGITSSDVAAHGFSVRRAMVMGQVLPGVPVWRLGEESRYPGMSYVVFPGNVGGPDPLVHIRNLMRVSRTSQHS